MFRVPFDLKEAFGRARPPVAVTVRGHTWRTTPGVYDGVGHIVVNRSVKAATESTQAIGCGSRWSWTVKPRTSRVPADLRAALAADPAAKAAFAGMSYTHRREYVEWVEDAKRPDTRARRVAGTVDGVRAGRPASLRRVTGTLAASVTPLRDAGAELDESAFEPLVDFFV